MATTRTRTARKPAADFQAAIRKSPAAPPVKFKTADVGPLPCRFPAAAEVPTVESIAQLARTMLNVKAGVYAGMDEQLRRKKLLDAKATREAAAAATCGENGEHLRDPQNVPYTRQAQAGLVTAVRKELVSILRREFRDADVAKREADRQSAKRAKALQRIRDRETAKAQRSAKVAVLPKGSKPSKSLSTATDRPVLTNAAIRKVDGEWQLITSDSYQACIYPLDVHGDAGLTECTIDTEAVKAIEKAGAFRIVKGQAVPLVYDTKVVFPAGAPNGIHVPDAREQGTTRYTIDTTTAFPHFNDTGRKPRGNQVAIGLRPAPAASKRMEISLDAKRLAQLQTALGTEHNVVTLVFDLDAFTKREDGVREWAIEGSTQNGVRVSPTIRIERPGGARAHLMPTRRKA